MLLVACEREPAPATATGAAVATGSVSPAAPVCVGAQDCLGKMNAARAWIAANSGLGLAVDSADTLETGGWGMPVYTAIRVARLPVGSDRYWIIATIQCGTGSGDGATGLCPDAAAAIADFNLAVSAAGR